MRFSRTSEWRPPRSEDPSRLVGSDGRFFAVTSDAAEDRAAHDRNVAVFRARAEREGWTIAPLGLPTALSRDDLSFELRIPARVTHVRTMSAALALDGRLYVVSCSFAARLQGQLESVCRAILDSVTRAPRTGEAPSSGRVVEDGSVALILPGDFREGRGNGARLFTSPSRDEAQVAVTIALSPASERVERAELATLRRRFEARGATVRSAVERELRGERAAWIDSEQRVEEQAAVRELVVYVHHQQRSVLAACAVREGDQRGHSACQRIIRSARRE